jgi:hypothetical protein
LKNLESQPSRLAGAATRPCRHIRCGVGDPVLGTVLSTIDVGKAHDPGKLDPFLALAQQHALFPADQRGPVGRTSAMVTDSVAASELVCPALP